MKCLILGGAGFLGSHIADQLVACGHEVRLFDRFEAVKTNIQHLLPRCELVQGDFGNHAIINDATRGMEVVYHLISTTLPKTSNDDMAFDLSTNVVSTLAMLDACVGNGVKKVVFISSGGTVYGTPEVIPIPETHPTNPICSYGIHKLAIEKYLHLYHYLHGLEYGVMRVANPYGERQRPDGAQGAVAVFLGKMLRDEPIEIWGDGSVVRDYLYVHDVAVAAEKLAGYAAGQDGPRTFNIGAGHGLSLLQVIEGLSKALGKTPQVRFSPARKLDVPSNVLDISAAKEHLKWSPAVGFEEGLRRTVACYL
ncbi:MAG TPA: NAD-dependent epimerase/dehydratase family protein [Phycisphaerae bacterium]|nr:NAD-dependent epimerase/dehydratase family protein [Phycisphaerae bacterium]